LQLLLLLVLLLRLLRLLLQVCLLQGYATACWLLLPADSWSLRGCTVHCSWLLQGQLGSMWWCWVKVFP
jgi:hypothetical protein